METIYTHIFETPIPANGKEIRNMFDDYHDQSCCETVYIDWEHFDNMFPQIEVLEIITKLEVKGGDDGLVIFLENGKEFMGDIQRVGIHCPIRERNNGYYSSNIHLTIKIQGATVTLDVQNFISDQN